MSWDKLDGLFEADGRLRKPTDEELAKHGAETTKHVAEVVSILSDFLNQVRERAINHDRSKYEEPERSAYAVVIPQLAGLEYGSPEHKKVLSMMKPAIRHHQEANRHHPEYHHSVAGMNLVDVVEMVADWIAAAKRSGGDPMKSLKVSLKRFNIDDQLGSIITNTIEALEKKQ